MRPRLRKMILAAALALLCTAPASEPAWASAELRIQSSAGGVIGDYLKLFMLAREAGHTVVIDGPCLSACTLVLSVMPRNRICVTRKAVLGFHAAWMPDEDGKVHTHRGATRLMMATYPQGVRKWIDRRGGLSRKTLLLRGRELNAMYRVCS